MLEDGNLSAMAALPTSLPPVAAHEVFTVDQWKTLLAICEVFMPSITSTNTCQSSYDQAREDINKILPTNSDQTLTERFLTETTEGDATFKESLRQRFAAHVPKAQVQGLAFLLSAVATRIGSFATTGSTVPIHARSLANRTKIVLGWADSYIAPLRALYQAAEFLTKATWLAQSTVLHTVIDYPKVPRGIERHPSYEFKFHDFSKNVEDEVVHFSTDIVIVGSGCGSGVVAEHLSASLSSLDPKPRILILEKGYHFPSSHFPMDQSAAGVNIQEGGGGILADDGSIAVTAGSTWGGGGTVNWSASLQPQRFVREEWARKYQLPFALSSEFQDCLDEVCGKMGVCRATDTAALAKIEQNFGNSTLLEGARRLGLTAEIVPQNTAGQRHHCGRCGLGCASATKQGPANYWLPAAAQNGAEFIEGCFVEKILWEADSLQERKATGLRATWTSRSRADVRKLDITAKYIIVSSGTLHSPLLLHRSGLTPETNKHIGSNLHLHPVLPVRGTYKERVDPWDGAILTSVMTSLENLDGKGHGPKIEILLGTPDIGGTMLPFRPQLSLRAMARALSSDASAQENAALQSALDYKIRVARHGHSFAFIAIQRDHADESNARRSYVYSDPDDARKVKINYTPSIKDRECLLQGAMTAARMHYIMGAETIEFCSPSIGMFERPSKHVSELDEFEQPRSDNEAFEKWLSEIAAAGVSSIDTKTTRLGSAHQMSTCRMSGSAADGVVDHHGKVFATNNVFVADASVLPSASGVNPMISTMGLSLHIAKHIAGLMQSNKDSN